MKLYWISDNICCTKKIIRLSSSFLALFFIPPMLSGSSCLLFSPFFRLKSGSSSLVVMLGKVVFCLLKLKQEVWFTLLHVQSDSLLAKEKWGVSVRFLGCMQLFRVLSTRAKRWYCKYWRCWLELEIVKSATQAELLITPLLNWSIWYSIDAVNKKVSITLNLE